MSNTDVSTAKGQVSATVSSSNFRTGVTAGKQEHTRQNPTMKTELKYIIALIAAAAMPLSLANAQNYQFNNNPANTSSGAPETIFGAPGGSVTISLQVVLPAGFAIQTVDYWLRQFSGPQAGVFSITLRDYTASEFPNPSATNAQVTSTADDRSNSMVGGAGNPDGIPDNMLNPQNGFNLGSSVNDATPRTNGTFQIANFTLSIAANAAPGIYQIRTFDYFGSGISDAAINIAVPEPATWSLIALGGIAAFGVNALRARRSRLS